MNHQHDDDDEKPDEKGLIRYEFECPECNAHNPYHDGFSPGHEIQCFYCGVEFKVVESDGRWRYKPT